MEFKYKLLAVVSTLALSTWAYNDLINNETTEQILQDQIDLLTRSEKSALSDSSDAETAPFIVARPENDLRNNRAEINSENPALVPQGPIYSDPLQAPSYKKTSVPKNNVTAQQPSTSYIVPQRLEEITLEEAVNAAIDGTEESLKILQKYFDSSAGQPHKITDLASKILNGLGAAGLVSNGDFCL